MWNVVRRGKLISKGLWGKLSYSKKEHPQVTKEINFLPSERAASYPCTVGQIH